MTSAISIVIPTFRRGRQLGALLDVVVPQVTALAGTELIVVDNDPHGSAEALVGQVQRARYLREDRPGASHARNAGIMAATGDVIAMLDDDVLPAADWLATLIAPILDGSADVTGGRVVLDPDVPRPRWFDDEVVGRYLTSFDLGPGPRPLTDDEFLVSASLAVRTALLRQVGGFDPDLGPRGDVQMVADDVALVRSLRRAGGRAVWVPGCVCVHELPASRLEPRWILRRAWLQGRSDWLLDVDELRSRRLGGARVAGSWLAGQLRRRVTEGVGRPDVAFHLACDVARTAGRLRQVLANHRTVASSTRPDPRPRG